MISVYNFFFFLGLREAPPKKMLLSYGNFPKYLAYNIYVRKHLKLRNDFEKNVNHIQNGVIEKVDFSDSARAAKAINDQVKKDTKGKWLSCKNIR